MAMPSAIPEQQAEFEFQAGSHPVEDFQVLGFELEEELSRPFFADVTVAPKPGVDVDPPALLGEEAQLWIHLDEGVRYVHGIVAGVKTWEAGAGDHRRQLRFRVVPQLWALGQMRQSRIFQALKVPEIVQKILKEGGVAVRPSLSGSYPPREYVVQYNESDLDFVSRLLEEEGIFFFFEWDDGKHTLVLADANSTCVPIHGDDQVPFREPSGQSSNADHFDDFSERREVRPSKVMLRDFNYLKPSTDLSATAGEGDGLEWYEFPGRYAEASVGKRYAKLRLEEQRAQAETFGGSSTCRRLGPGCTFQLVEHSLDAFNGKYVLTRVSHRGIRPELSGFKEGEGHEIYRNQVQAIRSDTPYRPPRLTPRPVVPGPQTAIVVGPSGEEIHTDSQGRVKVQFHWDRQGKKDQNASCWVRVGQSWAGAGWGALFLPRIGHEVVVEFIEGNPDLPLITGSVYNGLNTPPLALPGEKTRTTLRSASSPGGGGANELRFEDSKGGEEVYLHAQRDLEIVVEHDKTQKVGHDETLDVAGDRTRHVGGDQSLTVDGDDRITIDKNETLTVGLSRTTTIGGSETLTVGGSQTVTVDGAATTTVAAASAETVGAAKALTVGGAYAVTVGAAMNEAVGGLKAEEVGGAKAEVVGGKKTEAIAGSVTRTAGDDVTESVGGKRTLKVGKDLQVNVGEKMSTVVSDVYKLKAKEITFSAEDSFIAKVGSATLEMKKDGTVVIKGGKVQVKANGDIVLKGSKISEN